MSNIMCRSVITHGFRELRAAVGDEGNVACVWLTRWTSHSVSVSVSSVPLGGDCRRSAHSRFALENHCACISAPSHPQRVCVQLVLFTVSFQLPPIGPLSTKRSFIDYRNIIIRINNFPSYLFRP